MSILADKPKAPNAVAAKWVELVAAHFGKDSTAAKIAGQVAIHAQPDGRGELPSPLTLAKPLNFKEADAVEAVNAMIDVGLLRLRWTPYSRPLSAFAIDTGK
jgi:hypothetical protein